MLASVAENKCDDLAAMYQLLLSPGPVQDRVEAGVAGCGAALPSLSPTEVYTEAGDPGPGLDPSTRVAQGGRRHTMGPASHPLPGLQSPPPQFTLLQLKEILPQINLPQNLPPLSTDFSVKNQDLLRALPSPVPMGHHDSDCGVCSSQAREEAECAAEEEMAAADPGTMFSMLGGEMEAEAGLYCLGRDMRTTTSLFLMLLYTTALSLGSVASATPQHTRDTKSLSDTFMAARCLLGPDRSSVLSRMVATGSVTSGYRLSPAPYTGAHRGTRCRGSYLDTKPFRYVKLLKIQQIQ